MENTNLLYHIEYCNYLFNKNAIIMNCILTYQFILICQICLFNYIDYLIIWNKVKCRGYCEVECA